VGAASGPRLTGPFGPIEIYFENSRHSSPGEQSLCVQPTLRDQGTARSKHFGGIVLQEIIVEDATSAEESILDTFNELALELGLPDLHWDFVQIPGGTVIQGRPQEIRDVAACPRWARYLGMFAAGSEPNSHGYRWMGANGPWTLQIIGAVA
jgi:hypothetical protein